MGILIHQDADPLSAFSSDPDNSVPVRAASASAQLLRQELERYCSDMTEGRSFLIAGHRGSGKTTLVLSVIGEVLRLQRDTRPKWLRPLPILLHGPSLFDATEPARSPADINEQAGAALAQVVLGLHRHAVREFGRCYRERAVEAAAAVPGPAAGDILERAAQFQIEVLEDPHATRLREFWEQADALRDGVLHKQPPKPDQGMRELVALNGLCNAHQRISGDLRSKDTSFKEEKTDVLPSSFAKLRSLDLVKPVAATFAGTAVTAAGAVGHSLGASALLGLLAAGVTSLLFESGGQTSEKRSRQVDTVFIPDLTPKTLDRLIPVLIRRLREAGLAPVLIVDELDKVQNLAKRMDEMIPHLKKLVAESVFTCFLTDRGYLEHLRIEGGEKAYDSTYSYFSHTILMSYRPQDLDQYLQTKLGRTEPFVTADALDLQILPWVLRHRSRLHTLALQRELSAIRGDDGLILIPSGDLLSETAYRIDVTIQFAIELRLRDRHLASWLRQHPHKVELLHDALYYLSRQWLEGIELVCIDEQGQNKFFENLSRRMNLEEVRPREWALADPATPAPGSQAFTNDDRSLLLGVLKDMIRFLGVDQTLEAARNAKVMPGAPWPSSDHAVWEAMLLGPESLLEPVAGRPDAYEWRYWASGMSRAEGGEQLSVARKSAGNIAATERRLREVLGTPEADSVTDRSAFSLLTEQWRILPIAPAWSRVSEAMARVREPSASSPTSGASEEDCRVITIFAKNLTEYDVQLHWLLAQAASLAAATCGVAKDKPEIDAAATRRALQALSEGLRFASLDSKGIDAAMNVFRTRLRLLGIAVLKHDPAPRTSRVPGVAAFHIDTTVGQGRAHGAHQFAIAAAARTATVQAAWSSLHDRLRDAATPVDTASADASELLCAMWQIGPAATVGLDPQRTTLEQWTRATLAAWDTTQVEPERRVPVWVAHFGLENLGAGSLHPDLLGRLKRELQSVSASSPADGEAELVTLQSARPWKGTSDQMRVGLLVLNPVTSPAAVWTARPTAGLLAVARSGSATQALHMLKSTFFGKVKVAAEQPSADPSPEQMDDIARKASPNSTGAWLWVAARGSSTTHVPTVHDPKGPDDVLRAMSGNPA
jgi:hypothetical protein